MTFFYFIQKLLSISKENLQSKAGMSQAKTLDAQHLEDELQVKCGFCSTVSSLLNRFHF